MLRPFVQAYYRIDGAGAMVGGPGLSVDLWWLEGSPLTTAAAGGGPKKRSGAVIGGALTRMLSVRKGADAAGFGVSLAPMAAASLFGIEAAVLADDFVSMEDALKARAPGLCGRVQDARTPFEKARVIERELLELLGRRGGVDFRVARVMARIERTLEGVTVDSLAGDIGYTRRSLVNLVTRALGVSPKQLIRILRFRKALKLMTRWSDPDWLTVVHECGYVDQSHFIRHCKEFAGLTPGEFLRQRQFPPLEHQIPQGALS